MYTVHCATASAKCRKAPREFSGFDFPDEQSIAISLFVSISVFAYSDSFTLKQQRRMKTHVRGSCGKLFIFTCYLWQSCKRQKCKQV